MLEYRTQLSEGGRTLKNAISRAQSLVQKYNTPQKKLTEELFTLRREENN